MIPTHLSFTIHRGSPVHIGVCGSVAAYKAIEVMRSLQDLGLGVSVTLTQAASRFIAPLTFASLGAQAVYTSLWDTPDSAFGHLEPAQHCKAMIIAPATANTIARLAHGLADEILSAQALAFQGPVIIAPAMNPRLFDAPATQANLRLLIDRGVRVLDPDCGHMACGETGKGRLPGLAPMVAELLRALTPQDMAGRKVLVNLGPTHEYFDPVRYWSNPSSGLMGACLAMAAWLRGASVSVVHGPVSLWFPSDMHCVGVTSAQQMYEACTDLWPVQDMALMSAAVADFSPEPHGPEKFKKRGIASDTFSVSFTSNPDILRTLGQKKAAGQCLLGFCAETSKLDEWAAFKLKEKNCDLMVANNIALEGSGFGTSTNAVLLLDKTGRTETWPQLPKTEIAWRILEWMTQLLD